MADLTKYVPPQLCTGNWHLQDDAGDCGKITSTYAEQLVAESLEIAGAPINVFKLLGVHEQGKLIDLTGAGHSISGGDRPSNPAINVFTSPSAGWQSLQQGIEVTQSPAYIGYDFGSKTVTANGVTRQQYSPVAPVRQHITTIRIRQGLDQFTRASQLRVDSADGTLIPGSITFASDMTITNTSGYLISNISFVDSDHRAIPGGPIVPAVKLNESFGLTTTDGINFTVTSSTVGAIGTAVINQPFRSARIAFLLTLPTSITPDPLLSVTFTASVQWRRVDVVNVQNSADIVPISIRSSAPARYWRIVPLMFNGVETNARWEVERLELMDYEATSIDNVQDWLLQENRDRDYATSSVTLRCQYTPTDSLGDLSKFGLSILDQYVFECSFAKMVELLGRPIVTGDIIEVAPELAYDHNLRPVKKFLEVTDTGWAADGYTPGWKPTLYRFQAQQLLASQEHRNIINPPDKAFNIDNGEFFASLQQSNTGALQSSNYIAAEAASKVPETGTDISELEPLDRVPISEGRTYAPQSTSESQYVESGLPPAGIDYSEGYELPPISPPPPDGAYHRLNYPASTKIPSRLYKYSVMKNKWIYVETDRRSENTSYRSNVQDLLTSTSRTSLKGDI